MENGIYKIWWGRDRENEYGDHFFLSAKDAQKRELEYYKYFTVETHALVVGDQFYVLAHPEPFSTTEFTRRENAAKEKARLEKLKKSALAKLTPEERKALGHE